MKAKAIILVSLLVTGCSIAGVKRAPVDKLPSDLTSEERIEAIEGMKEKYPNDPYLYLTLGKLYYNEFLAPEAKQNFEKALAIDPKLNEARVYLATLHMETGETDSAKTLLEEALKISPKDTKALTKMGVLYYSNKDVAKAVTYFDRAIKLDPKCVEAHYNLGLAFAESGLLSEAINEWRKVLEIAPDGETADQARMALDRVERIRNR